jgi:CrcB protein
MSAPPMAATGNLRADDRPRPPRHRQVPLDVLAAISAGGALGALARYGLSTAIPHDGDGFPWSTLLINVTGCLLIGVVMALLTDPAGRPHRLARPFFGVGLLGGYTTFSTYAVDTVTLVRDGATSTALGYVLGTLVAAVVAVQVGATATRTVLAVARKEL